MKHQASIALLLAALSGGAIAEGAVGRAPANLLALNAPTHRPMVQSPVKPKHAAAFDQYGSEKALAEVTTALHRRLDAQLQARVERNLEIAAQ